MQFSLSHVLRLACGTNQRAVGQQCRPRTGRDPVLVFGEASADFVLHALPGADQIAGLSQRAHYGLPRDAGTLARSSDTT